MNENTSSFHRVGVGMPVYNGERYLEEVLRSTLAQTFNDFVLVIADNASVDRTEEICRDYASSDERIKYIRNPINLGASKNYTCCFELANCEYFRWANSDDLIEPTLVEMCVKILDEHPDTVLSYGKTKIIDEDGGFTEYYDDCLDLRQERASDRFLAFIENIGLSNVLYGLMRRDKLAKTGLLGSYLASDINLIGELALYGKFYEIDEYMFSRRMHPEASSWDKTDIEKQKEFWDPAQKKFLMQTWRSIFEYYKAVLRAPITINDKRVLVYYLLKRSYWYRRKMTHELACLLKSVTSKR